MSDKDARIHYASMTRSCLSETAGLGAPAARGICCGRRHRQHLRRPRSFCSTAFRFSTVSA